MAGYKCPFCEMVMALNAFTLKEICVDFNGYVVRMDQSDNVLTVNIFKCPNCGQLSACISGNSGQFKGISVNIRPYITCMQLPDYIPKAIKSDYEEACAIAKLSPKASATLSRRCLQGMIRDFWNIRKAKLSDEIEELKGKIPFEQWKVIDGLRRLGNIGAHMEKDINLIIDIDTDEADKLIKLIELLIKDWYINRNEQQKLYSDILGIDAEKKEQRRATVSQ